MTIEELIARLRTQIGDNHPTEPNITDTELTRIIEDSATEYSRIKGFINFYEIIYTNDINIYNLPQDSLKVKSVKLKETGEYLSFIDNLDQIILETEPSVTSGTIIVTYIVNYLPSDINSKDISLCFLYAEALCYKLMASKSADFIKFSTGEKMVDESGISKKYLELFKSAEKEFKKKAIRAFGKRMSDNKPDLNYKLPYPIEGEEL